MFQPMTVTEIFRLDRLQPRIVREAFLLRYFDHDRVWTCFGQGRHGDVPDAMFQPMTVREIFRLDRPRPRILREAFLLRYFGQ